MMRNNILTIVFVIFGLNALFANDLSVNDSKELLSVVSTQKDLNDALNFISESDNLSSIKVDKNIISSIETLSDKFNITIPAWLSIEAQPEVSINESQPVKSDSNEDEKSSKSLITIFFLSFAAGFAALLTPCVFPMIPMTVSFFTKQSKSKAQGC